jgi:hypothetical protein
MDAPRAVKMSRQFAAAVGGAALALMAIAGAAGGVQGCGSSGGAGRDGGSGGSAGGGDLRALCNQSCDKVGTCFADAGVPVDPVIAQCKNQCQTQSQGQACSNASEVTAAVRACLDKPCGEEFDTCLGALPPCEGAGGGTGGGSGSGWTCTEVAATTTGCLCMAGTASSGSCTASYTCCFRVVSQGTCTCTSSISAAECPAVAPSVGGTVVSTCPPP